MNGVDSSIDWNIMIGHDALASRLLRSMRGVVSMTPEGRITISCGVS